MWIFALIPALPLAAFLILALAGRRLGRSSLFIGIPAVAASFALSVAALAVVARGGAISLPLYRFVEAGDFVVDVGLYIDQLAVLLLPLVTGVSFVVHVYSARYMIGDPRFRRFFAVMSLFTFAMTMLVTSNNLLVTYMCWELMGICSYLLISHWADRPAAGRAATKAFLVNAVADVGLGFGVILAFATYGTLNIQEILAQASAMSGETLAVLGFEVSRNTLITLCLLSGAMGKSAQVPMHVWLPFAMEAPTPISALIHAATMVNAGPFLLVRMSPLVLLAPPAMVAIAVVGAVTALYGALVSLTQSDIKKLLAYSTISQIGFMIFACGVGAFVAAVFHLLAHGFLKAFLFLSTGSALESMRAHGENAGPVPANRMRPLALGALLFTLVPTFVLFYGPYERVWNAHQVPAARAAFWAVALATVFLGAAYVFRQVVSLFGSRVGNSVTAWPRLFSRSHFLATYIATIAVGALLLGLWSWFGAFLAPALAGQFTETRLGAPSPILVIPLAIAAAGWGLAYARYLRPTAVPLADRGWVRRAYVHFLNRLYFDELHNAVAVKPTLRLSRWLWRDLDLRWVNRAVHGAASATRLLAQAANGLLEVPVIDRAVHGVARVSHLFAQAANGLLEVPVIDRAVHGVARVSHLFAQAVHSGPETRVIDRAVHRVAPIAVGMSRWLWKAVDLRGIEGVMLRAGRAASHTGAALRRLEPRTLRHHLAIVVGWLVAAIGLLYWLLL